MTTNTLYKNGAVYLGLDGTREEALTQLNNMRVLFPHHKWELNLETPAIDSDNSAVMQGYTLQVMAEAEDGSHTLFLLVKPGFREDTVIRAWDTDEQEWLNVRAWMYDFHLYNEG